MGQTARTPHARFGRRPARRTIQAAGDAHSGLWDLAAEYLEDDCVRGSAATAGVQAVERGHLTDGQLEVEDLDVLCDALGLGGLRNDRSSSIWFIAGTTVAVSRSRVKCSTMKLLTQSSGPCRQQAGSPGRVRHPRFDRTKTAGPGAISASRSAPRRACGRSSRRRAASRRIRSR